MVTPSCSPSSRATPERVLDIVLRLGACTAEQIRDELGASTVGGVAKTINRLLDAGWLTREPDGRVLVRPVPSARDRWWAAATLRRAYLLDGDDDLAKFMSAEAYRWGRLMKLEANGDGEQPE